MIDKRPKIVDDKERVSDWEGDTIIGKDYQIGPPKRCHSNISRTKVKVHAYYSTRSKKSSKSRRKNNTYFA